MFQQILSKERGSHNETLEDRLYQELERPLTKEEEARITNLWLTNLNSGPSHEGVVTTAQHEVTTALILASLPFSQDLRRALVGGAVIHDTGKYDPSLRHLLDYQLKYSDDQRLQMRTHPQLTKKIVTDYKLPPFISDILLYHHERGGKKAGYPYRLELPEIPFSAQAMRVADCLEAATSPNRPFNGKPKEIAIVVSELRQQIDSGEFDPQVREVLSALFLKFSDPGKIEAARKEAKEIVAEITQGEDHRQNFNVIDRIMQSSSNI